LAEALAALAEATAYLAAHGWEPVVEAESARRASLVIGFARSRIDVSAASDGGSCASA